MLLRLASGLLRQRGLFNEKDSNVNKKKGHLIIRMGDDEGTVPCSTKRHESSELAVTWVQMMKRGGLKCTAVNLCHRPSKLAGMRRRPNRSWHVGNVSGRKKISAKACKYARLLLPRCLERTRCVSPD